MQLIVNGQCYDDPPSLNKKGGEGELYSLEPPKAAKVYFEDKRSRDRAKKVLALCNTFGNSAARGHSTDIAYPEFPAYGVAAADPLDALVGFSMHWFDGSPQISDLQFDLRAGAFGETQGFRFDDKSAIEFVYNIFELFDRLHAAPIVLGDVNSGNVLYNPRTRRPVVIDIDSAQIGGWPCPMWSESYIDPRLLQRPRDRNGGFTYSADTDTYALAVVCFEFLIGRRPYQIRVKPVTPKLEVDNKQKGISYIRCVEEGRRYLDQLGNEYVDGWPNPEVEARLKWLKAADPRLYDFFCGVFIRGERQSLLFSLPLTDSRHPGNRFLIDSGAWAALQELRKRQANQRRAAAVARQGAQRPGALPDSGARQAIGALLARTSKATAGATAPSAAASAAPAVRADPVGFDFFVQHFGLDV